MSIHVYPADDWIDHWDSTDCPCEPEIEWEHPESGEVYSEPLVIHQSVSGDHQ